MLEAAIKL